MFITTGIRTKERVVRGEVYNMCFTPVLQSGNIVGSDEPATNILPTHTKEGVLIYSYRIYTDTGEFRMRFGNAGDEKLAGGDIVIYKYGDYKVGMEWDDTLKYYTGTNLDAALDMETKVGQEACFIAVKVPLDTPLQWFTFEQIETDTEGKRFVRNKASTVDPAFRGNMRSGKNVALSGDGYIDVPINYDDVAGEVHGSITYFDFTQKKHISISAEGETGEYVPAWISAKGTNITRTDIPDGYNLLADADKYYSGLYLQLRQSDFTITGKSMLKFNAVINSGSYLVYQYNNGSAYVPFDTPFLITNGINEITFPGSYNDTDIRFAPENTSPRDGFNIDMTDIQMALIVGLPLAPTYRMENVTFNSMVVLWDRSFTAEDRALMDADPSLVTRWGLGEDVFSIGVIGFDDLVYCVTEDGNELLELNVNAALPINGTYIRNTQRQYGLQTLEVKLDGVGVPTAVRDALTLDAVNETDGFLETQIKPSMSTYTAIWVGKINGVLEERHLIHETLNLYTVTVGQNGSNYGFTGSAGAITPNTFKGVPITYLGSFGEFWTRVDVPKIAKADKIYITMNGKTWDLDWYEDGTRYAGTAPFSLWDYLGTTIGIGNDVSAELSMSTERGDRYYVNGILQPSAPLPDPEQTIKLGNVCPIGEPDIVDTHNQDWEFYLTVKEPDYTVTVDGEVLTHNGEIVTHNPNI